MDEQFVPELDYAICPKCKEMVDLPKKMSIRIRSKKKDFTCPHCGSNIEYVERSRLLGPPFPLE
jgi:RNase P subunit RPR2